MKKNLYRDSLMSKVNRNRRNYSEAITCNDSSLFLDFSRLWIFVKEKNHITFFSLSFRVILHLLIMKIPNDFMVFLMIPINSKRVKLYLEFNETYSDSELYFKTNFILRECKMKETKLQFCE